MHTQCCVIYNSLWKGRERVVVRKSELFFFPSLEIERSSSTYCKSEEIKHFCAKPPSVRIAILSLALVVETINLSYLSALMVSSQKRHFGWPACFQKKEKRERLKTIVSSINEISHKYVTRLRHSSARIKQL